MRFLRCCYRLLRLSIHILWGLVLIATVFRGAKNNPLTPKQLHAKHHWLVKTGHITGLQITTRGEAINTAALVASNHISWLDIIALASVMPVSFLSKSEVRNWPFVGTLAGAAGTLFIKRGGKNAANHAIELMTDKLQHGQSVVFFPEGTTTHGDSVSKFHPRLFSAAVEAKVPVQPVAITYPHPNGIHPIVPFVGDDDLLKNGLKILSEPFIPVVITFCTPP